MNIYKKIPSNLCIKNPAISIGTFDGVHLGHKEIFKQLLITAESERLDHLVITFYPHPRKILNPGTPPRILTTINEKIKAISECGIENIVVLKFDEDFAEMRPADFIDSIISTGFGISHLVTGYDHAFGKNRDGDWDFLRQVSVKKGFGITRVDHLDFHSRPVSSTWIRAEIEDGNINIANSLLGRKYSLTGTVIKGFGRGNGLGFPTANIEPDEPGKIIPKDGVYAVRCRLHDLQIKGGMINIGTNPTFAKTERTIEVNIFDFKEDIYGKQIEIFFHDRIRDEIKFQSPDDLISQLHKDKAVTIKILNNSVILNKL